MYLTSLFAYTAYGNALTLKDLGVFVPQISAIANTGELDDRKEFSEFVSLISVLEEFAISGITMLLSGLEWRSFIVFISPEYYSFYEYLLKGVNSDIIKILNPDSLRFFPSNYSISDFASYTSHFSFALQSRCRLYMILSSNPIPILEGLYKIGLRQGDIITLWYKALVSSSILSQSSLLPTHIKSLLTSSLLVTFQEWETSLGRSLKKVLKTKYKDPSCMCATYDSFTVIHNSIKYLIATGEDFEDYEILIKTMRNQRFIGCLGNIYFNSDNNHWPGMKLLFQQLVLDEKNENFEIFDVLVADVLAIRTVSVINQPQWTGFEAIPSNFISFGDCGFNPRIRSDCWTGRLLRLAGFGAFFLTCLNFSVLGGREFRKKFRKFEVGSVISNSDLLMMMFFGFEGFQFICLEPDYGLFDGTLHNVHKFLAFRVNEYFVLQFEEFWRFYLVVVVFSNMMTLITIFKIQTHPTLPKANPPNPSKSFTLPLLPLLPFISCHILFIPLNYLLLNILNCNNSTSSTLTSCYHESDCNQNCYSGRHLLYLLIGLFTSLTYSAVSSYSRIPSESLLPNINLRTNPVYLSYLNIFQAFILLIRVILSEFSQIISGFVLSFLLILFAFYTFYYKSYNLDRLRVLQTFVLLLSGISLLCSSLYVMTGKSWLFVNLAIACFVFAAAVAAALIKKLPLGFLSQEGVSVERLVRFQFGVVQDGAFEGWGGGRSKVG